MRTSRRMCLYGFNSGSFDEHDFTYTGTYSFSVDSTYTIIKFLSSGTFTPKKEIEVDFFACGGGGGGGSATNSSGYGGGGGGGYTSTVLA